MAQGPVTRGIRTIILVGVLFGLASVGAQAAGLVFGLSLADQSTLSQQMRQGVEAAASQWNVEVKAEDAAGQATKQAEDIGNLVKAGVQALLVQPVDPVAVAPAIAAAVKAGIPVATLVTPVAGEVATFHVVPAYRLAGRWAGEHLSRLVTTGTLVVIGPGDGLSKEVAGGFDTFCKGLPYVVTRLTAATRAEAAEALKKEIESKGLPAGVFALTPETLLGALRALNGAEGGKDVPTVGYGTTPEVSKVLRSGRLSAVVVDKGYDLGVIATESMLGLIHKLKKPAKVILADPGMLFQ
ncbi:MAG: sugar ABC transporter substrate-binding protein [Chitinophagales bacterium]